MVERIRGVEQLRELELRCLRFWRGRASRLARIARDREEILLDLFVAFEDLRRAPIPELLQLRHITLRRFGEITERERQNIGAGETHDRLPGRLREGAAVHKSGVAEMRIPIEVVVDRVIDAPIVFAAVAEVEGCDAEMLKEGRVVGP